MLIDIYMKFRGDNLERFSSLEWTWFLRQSKGNNSRSINARVMVLVLCMSSNVD